jgi:RsiW-degrading membrane proteinase PrsW (M82 family)
MDENAIFYVISALLAFIPALIWLGVIFKKTKRKLIQTFLFLGGTLAVIPVFLLQYLLQRFPQFDVIGFLQAHIFNQNLKFLLVFIGVGIVEEIAKQGLVRFVDKKYLLIQTIGESIQFSLVAALAFAFAENIFYIYNIWLHLGLKQLFIAYFFRSIFTTCAHLIFAGFFGYFYGLAKFSLQIREQSRWIGKKLYFTNTIAALFGLSKAESFKQVMILKGLFLAIILHAVFDFLLELNYIIPVVIFVMLGYWFLRMLLKQKSGHLILITDVDNERASSMAKNDEEVVIELLGMWFKEKRYVDVIHICERLLKRDPDNKVVQLFKAQAADKMDKNNVYSKILTLLFPQKDGTLSLAQLEKRKDVVNE